MAIAGACVLAGIVVTASPQQPAEPPVQQVPPAGAQPVPPPVVPPAPPTPPVSSPVAPVAPVPPNARIFASEAGMIFNAIKPDKVADFDMIVGRLRQALTTSIDPVRRQQAAGWRVFKAAEPGPSGSILYVFVMDPVVKGADYGVAKILAEAYPEEVQELYKLYNGAFAAGQTLLNLQPLPEQGIGGPGTVPQPLRPLVP